MKRVTVFCASSDKIPQIYIDEARELARLLAQSGFGVVYGGGEIGLMGAVANEMLANNAPITGVIPRFMVDVEWQHRGVSDMILTETMAERKRKMIDLADAIVILPGSTGTMDELFDALADKKLGLIWKPIVALNTNHFYDHLKAQLELMVSEKFMNERHFQTITFASTPAEAVKCCENGDESQRIKLHEAAV